MRDTAGKFDDLQTTLQVTVGISDYLAVFLRQQASQILRFALHQGFEGKHHPRATLRIDVGPILLGRFRRGDRLVDLRCGRQSDGGFDVSEGRVEDVGRAPAGARDGFASDEMPV